MATPEWLHVVAAASLIAAGASAAAITLDELVHPQRMWIMNVVWPVVALWAGPFGLLAYFTIGRRGEAKPLWQQSAVAATHCGSGCALADLVVEWTVVAIPVTLFGSRVFGTWAVDLVVAFVFGVAFQYFTIAPMRHLSVHQGIIAAVKADALSLAAWQLGMYGWMAVALFVLFSEQSLPKHSAAFWFMMQIAMCFGFLVSYPVNWWLLSAGIKEPM